MKILFLDFDGVIITWRSYSAREDWNKGGNPHDVTVCKFLERLFFYSKEIPLKLVISSSWRFGEEMCKEVLQNIGLLEYLHDDWRTTIYIQAQTSKERFILQAMKRGQEIQEWLDRHPEITEYRILDDDTNMLEKQLPSFIQCDGVDGLGGRDMRKLINWIAPPDKRVHW